MINNKFTETFSVYRNTWTTDAGGFKSSTLASVGTFKGVMQQTSAEDTEFLRLSFNKSFTIFCPLNTNIKSTDIIRFNGFDYGVRNLIDYREGINKHKQVYLEQLEAVIGS